MNENEIGKIVVDCAIQLHMDIGPGLLESVYELLLVHKLQERGLHVSRQVSIPIKYNNIKFDEGFKADILVENKVILELKSTEVTARVHKKQVLTYLKLSELKLGYLLNFGQELMKDVITRFLNGTIE
ncbi:GxxExxY protein [bacterium]|nr:GxxExxY protein [bacterium]